MIGRRLVDPAAALYLPALAVAAAQLATSAEPLLTLRGIAPYLAAAAALIVVRVVGERFPVASGTWISILAVAGAALALWTLTAFVVALPAGLDDPSGFYLVKVRVSTPVGDHNTVGGLLLPGVAAAAVTAARSRPWLAVLVVTSLGLAATLSRGAVIVLLLAAVVTWPLATDVTARLRLLAAGGGALVLILVTAALLGAAPTVGSPEVDSPVGASVVARSELIGRGIEVGAAQPWRGGGLRTFEQHATDLPRPHHHAHNLVAHAFAEGGVPLAAVSVALPVVLALRLRRGRPGPLRDVLVGGGVGLVLQSQHDVLGGLAGYEVLLAVLVALAALAQPPRLGAS